MDITHLINYEKLGELLKTIEIPDEHRCFNRLDYVLVESGYGIVTYGEWNKIADILYELGYQSYFEFERH